MSDARKSHKMISLRLMRDFVFNCFNLILGGRASCLPILPTWPTYLSTSLIKTNCMKAQVITGSANLEISGKSLTQEKKLFWAISSALLNINKKWVNFALPYEVKISGNFRQVTHSGK